nr:MAG TPA: hypothetical protein [Caudoviricetes sp.]
MRPWRSPQRICRAGGVAFYGQQRRAFYQQGRCF